MGTGGASAFLIAGPALMFLGHALVLCFPLSPWRSDPMVLFVSTDA